jgi:hypothetical protein
VASRLWIELQFVRYIGKFSGMWRMCYSNKARLRRSGVKRSHGMILMVFFTMQCRGALKALQARLHGQRYIRRKKCNCTDSLHIKVHFILYVKKCTCSFDAKFESMKCIQTTVHHPSYNTTSGPRKSGFTTDVTHREDLGILTIDRTPGSCAQVSRAQYPTECCYKHVPQTGRHPSDNVYLLKFHSL